MKTLVLCRHAKSDWDNNLSDFERPLNDRGRRDAPAMGLLLRKSAFSPDQILSSPATRALTTARLVAEQLRHAPEIVQDQRLYEATTGTALSVIQETHDRVDTLMVFGHNPTTELLAAFLMQSQGGITMPTAGMICLEANVHSWRELGARPASLKWFIIPKVIGRD